MTANHRAVFFLFHTGTRHGAETCVKTSTNFLVRSQHPPTQWNLRGGRRSSVELRPKNPKNSFFNFLMKHTGWRDDPRIFVFICKVHSYTFLAVLFCSSMTKCTNTYNKWLFIELLTLFLIGHGKNLFVSSTVLCFKNFTRALFRIERNRYCEAMVDLK